MLIRSNRADGLAIRSGHGHRILAEGGCEFDSNLRSGVFVGRSTEIRLEDSSVSLNSVDGIKLACQFTSPEEEEQRILLAVRNGFVRDNRNCGIYVLEKVHGTLSLDSCAVNGNGFGVVLATADGYGCDLAMTDCSVSGSRRTGIVVERPARLELTRATLSG